MPKTYKDDKGYLRYKDSNRLVHRWLAYKQIYLPNREYYPNDFGEYVIHHKDGNRMNNDPSNLQIIDQDLHAKMHGHSSGLIGIINRILNF